MKVICIDASGFIYCKPLTEGAIYDVIQSDVYPDSWIVKGFEKSIGGNNASYKKIRFIPLSNIDEMEIIKQRQTQYA
jgi:hypothetical protein